MSRHRNGAVDARQIGFEFSFAPERHLVPSGIEEEGKPVLVEVPVPLVLRGETLSIPQKVRSVFDDYFDPREETEVVQIVQPKELPPGFEDLHSPYPFEWSDEDVATIHSGLLRNSLTMFRGKCSDETLICELAWIFASEFHLIDHAVEGTGRSIQIRLDAEQVPFSFRRACALEGADADVVQNFVRIQLRESNRLHLLDCINFEEA